MGTALNLKRLPCIRRGLGNELVFIHNKRVEEVLSNEHAHLVKFCIELAARYLSFDLIGDRHRVSLDGH